MSRTIVVTGARGGQGTTTVAAALALYAAAHNETVLVSPDRDAAAALLGIPTHTSDEPIPVVGGLTLVSPPSDRQRRHRGHRRRSTRPHSDARRRQRAVRRAQRPLLRRSGDAARRRRAVTRRDHPRR